MRERDRLNLDYGTKQFRERMPERIGATNWPEKRSFATSNSKRDDLKGVASKQEGEKTPTETVGFKQGDEYCKPCEEYKQTGRISAYGKEEKSSA